MVADTFSSILGWLDQGTGNNNNVWGDNCDLSIFPILERAITGKLALAITGGTSDYSTAGTNPPNAAHMLLDYVVALTGTLTATHTILVPNIVKTWRFINNTTGAFGVKIKTSSGTAVNIPQGRVTDITCDGSNVCYRSDKDEVGSYEIHASAVPNGSFECAGGTKLIADYPDLYAKLSTTYGGNGITTFGLPDLKTSGLFIRSRTGSVAVGTTQTDLIANHLHQIIGAVSITGSTGNDAADHTHAVSATTSNDLADHTHSGVLNAGSVATNTGNFAIGGPSSFVQSVSNSNSGGVNSNHTHSFSTTSGGVLANHTHPAGSLAGSTNFNSGNNVGGGAETRPANISAIVCIRY